MAVDDVDHEYTTIFYFHSCSREIIDFFSHSEEEKNVGLFLRHHESKVFQTLHAYNLDLGLHCHSRFDDLDFVSGSQVCQNCKLQIACLGFLSFVI